MGHRESSAHLFAAEQHLVVPVVSGENVFVGLGLLGGAAQGRWVGSLHEVRVSPAPPTAAAPVTHQGAAAAWLRAGKVLLLERLRVVELLKPGAGREPSGKAFGAAAAGASGREGPHCTVSAVAP